ncbi:hypothetical protein, partial [Klebsiella pneumoniae]|uniref:hypothetical protein n=1 Tax=Klebsiella pneumoniae TaxID=573 RepID=UPI001954124A
GQDLIDVGMTQGKWFGPALAAANAHLEQGGSFEAALAIARGFQPEPAGPIKPLHAAGAIAYHVNIAAELPE